MCLAIPPRTSYLIDIVEFPSEIWSRLDRPFGQHIEDISTDHWENTSDISLQDLEVFIASITSHEVEVVQDEEMIESSTQSIRICESLLDETPSTADIEVCEKFDVSCFHLANIEEEIQTYIVEEELSFHPS